MNKEEQIGTDQIETFEDDDLEHELKEI